LQKISQNFAYGKTSLNRCYTRLLRPSHSLQDGFLRSKKMAKGYIGALKVGEDDKT